MKTNLQHIRLNVSDIERSLKWYTEVLGFEVGNCWPLDNPIYYDFLSDNGATFSIGQVKGVKPSGRVNFTVENVDCFSPRDLTLPCSLALSMPR